MLFNEIIAVYTEIHMKLKIYFVGKNAEMLIVTSGGTHSYH
jgi:hypothetical protein